MIIFGTRGLTSKKDHGLFYCPSCDASCSSRTHKVRKWFTLYFIPVLPLGLVGEYVECSGCNNTFGVESAYRTKVEYNVHQLEVRAEYENGIRNIMILLMLGDGQIDKLEMRTIQDIYSNLTGEQYETTSLENDIREVQAQGQTVADYAKKLNGLLNGKGKSMVIEAAIKVAFADGSLDKKEEKLIYRLAKELDYSKSSIKQYIAESQTS